MFAESTPLYLLIRKAFYISIYNEHMFGRRYTYTSLSRPYSFLSIILYLYTEKGNTLSRTFLPFTTAPLFTLLLYTLYIERNILSRNFYHFSRPFLTFYYTPIIYRRGNIFPAPFLPLYILL